MQLLASQHEVRQWSAIAATVTAKRFAGHETLPCPAAVNSPPHGVGFWAGRLCYLYLTSGRIRPAARKRWKIRVSRAVPECRAKQDQAIPKEEKDAEHCRRNADPPEPFPFVKPGDP